MAENVPILSRAVGNDDEEDAGVFVEEDVQSTQDTAARNIGGGGLRLRALYSVLIIAFVSSCAVLILKAGVDALRAHEMSARTSASLAVSELVMEKVECGRDLSVNFNQAKLVSNNLGPRGNISIENVMPGRRERINMNVSLDWGTYLPVDTKENRLRNDFLVVNLQAGSEAHLRFTLFDAKTGIPVAFGPFLLSFLQLSRGSANGCLQQVTASDFVDYFPKEGDQTDLSLVIPDYAQVEFEVKQGNDVSVPWSPSQLSPWQQRRVATLKFKDTSSLRIRLSVTAGDCEDGRNFLISGPSPLVCAR